MAVFAYKASDIGEEMVMGSIAADTPRQARELLRAKGLSIHEVTEQRVRAGGRGTGGGGRAFFARRSPSQVVSVIRELATLLGVGIPLLESLDSIIRQHRGAFRTNLMQLREQVSTGVSLADAMREQPAIFDEISVSMVEVGESAGSLDAVLERLAEFKERSLQLKDRVTTALLYPCVVLLMAIAVSIFLMTFVIPKLLEALLSAGKPLPFPTRVVKGVSDFLLSDWWLLLLIVAGVIGLFTLITRTPVGRRAWHRVQLRVPIIGAMIRKQAIVRIAVVISTLMRSGVVFLKALEIAQRATKNVILKDALARCEAAVGAGSDISEALEQTGAFPPLMVQIFSVGQQSGRLEEMLEKLAADFDRQVNTSAQRLTAMLEPALILVMVVVVGFIAFATVLPMLEANDVL